MHPYHVFFSLVLLLPRSISLIVCLLLHYKIFLLMQLFFNILQIMKKLHSFECLCYPWLCPYTAHTLDPRSKPYIFLGYSLSQSAYVFFEPESSKIIVFRHVSFIEHIFPYHSLHKQESLCTSTTVDIWIPLVITIPTSTSAPSTHSSAAAPDARTLNPTSPPLVALPPSLGLENLSDISSLPFSATPIPTPPTPTPVATLPTQAEPLPCHPMTT